MKKRMSILSLILATTLITSVVLYPMAAAVNLSPTISENNISTDIEYETGTAESQMLFQHETTTRSSAPYATFSYNLTPDAEERSAEAIIDLTFHDGDNEYTTSLAGTLEIHNLSDSITLVEGGPLESSIVIAGIEYEIQASFQKRIGQKGACLGLSVKPAGSEEFPVFIKLGTTVYTDEVKAVHPLYTSSTVSTNASQSLSFSPPSTPNGFTRACNVSIPVPSNPYVSGTGMRFYAYYKPKGTSSTTGSNKNFNLLLFAPYTNCDELSNSVNLANVYLTEFSLASSTSNDCPFERFYGMPAPNTSDASNFYNILAGGLTVLGFVLGSNIPPAIAGAIELLQAVAPASYVSNINPSTKTSSTFKLTISSINEVKFDDVPAAVTYEMRCGQTGTYNINVTPSFKYKYLSSETVYFFTVSSQQTISIKCVA